MIIPAWTWYLLRHGNPGGRPAGVRGDRREFNLDPADIERHITPQTRVIMAVHLQGNPADMDPILALENTT